MRMSSDDHPTYENPTIVEAICEIHFSLGTGVAWNPSLYSALFRRIQDQFPVFQPVATPSVQMVIGTQGAPTTAFTIPQLIRYQSTAGNVLLQLSETTFAVNFLPEYPGWEKVVDRLSYGWRMAFEVIEPAQINRMGLRYINRIERGNPNETLDTWLVANEYLPLAVLHSRPGFAAQIVTQLDSHNRLSVIVADQPASLDSHGAFILDLDRTIEYEMPVDIDHLLQQASRLHDNIWEVFQSAKGDKLEALLRGEIV